jgi:hypothetical protein
MIFVRIHPLIELTMEKTYNGRQRSNCREIRPLSGMPSEGSHLLATLDLDVLLQFELHAVEKWCRLTSLYNETYTYHACILRVWIIILKLLTSTEQHVE